MFFLCTDLEKPFNKASFHVILRMIKRFKALKLLEETDAKRHFKSAEGPL